MLTEDKFQEFKRDYLVFGFTSTMDQYRNEQRTYSDTPKCTIHVMWHPITDEASVVAYGDKVVGMLQCVYYGSEVIENFDHVSISGSVYEVVSVKQFNTYRLIQVRKL